MDMEISIKIWEKSLKTLRASRERVVLKTQFLRLHLLYLTQEKIIIELFESQEKELSHKIIEMQQKVINY